MPSTISSSDALEPGGGRGGGRCIDYTQNGTLWVTLSDNALDEIHWFRSTDGGVNWSEVTAMKLTGANGESHSFFIDKDNNIHVVYVGTSSTRTYRLGTPNDALNPTSYTWGTPLGLITVGNFLGMEIVAHREGTGWKAHIIHTTTDGGGPTTKCYYDRVNITSGYVVTSDVQTLLKDYGVNNGNACAIDFRHEQGDPKAVQSSTPSVYVAYHEPGGFLFYRKIAYSAGVWTPGAERTIDANSHFGNVGTLSLIYDGTRIAMTSQRGGPDGVVRVDERDEADTTTTNRNPTALADGNIQNMAVGYVLSNQDMWVVAQGDTSDDWKKIRFDRGAGTWAGAWTTIEADTASLTGWMALMRGMVPGGGSLGVAYFFANPTPNQAHYEAVVSGWQGEASLQGVATAAPEASLGAGGAANLQGVSTVSGGGAVGAGAGALLQGIARVLAIAEGVPFLDFTRYDAYIETGGQVYGLIFFHDQQPQTVARQLEPTRQNVGNNPDEIRPDFGNFFAQSDFSHGMGQVYFHQPGRDAKKVFYLEGFDITDPGRLTHLHALAEARDTTTIGAIAQVDGKPFVINGNRVDRSDSFPAGWTQEDPSGAEADQTVEDITAEGARLFAAIGSGGVHVRDSGGTWTHYKPDGAIDLDVTPATRVAWLKERLMVVGNTASRSIYEVTNDSTILASPLETLPEGWTFEDIFEAGGFIHACAVNPSAGMSRVHHYGLNTAGSALEKKSSTKFPQGQLIYCGEGFPGMAFVAGGVRNEAGGYDPILYRATMNDRGELDYAEVRQEEGAGSNDLSARSIATTGEEILVGWSTGAGTFGGARDGIAVYHVARDAFAYHLKKTGAGGGRRIVGIMPFNGQVLVSIGSDGLYYEDLATFVTTATLVTSLADWNNAGLKVWDTIEVSHAPLGIGTTVKVEYGTEAQEDASWTEVFTSAVVNSVGDSGQVSNVNSRMFALRITSTATASIDQTFLGYSVRSLPAPDRNEFQLTRYLRLVASDQKDEDAQRVLQDPRTLLSILQDALFSFVVFYESGFSWTAWLEDVSTFEPQQPMYETTQGEALKDVFYVQLKMTGAR